MELYDKRPVTCRIAPFADRKDDTQYGIYNKADTSDRASDQTEYTWINHKRPVACKVACFEDKTNIRYINRHVASDHRNIHEGIISDQVASTKTSELKLKCLYCLRAAKACLSAKCLFNRFGREYGPSPQPSTGQG